MTLLAIDLGTTHCKAGIFHEDGTALKAASRSMRIHRTPQGVEYYEPEEVWSLVSEVIREAAAGSHTGGEPVRAIGIASMAETGLLVDSRTGAPRSFFVPWFDQSSQAQADTIRKRSDAYQCYLKFGLHVTFKDSLAKILWLRETDPTIVQWATWLSAADFIAFRLTGKIGTDYSLAGRTFAFRVDRKEWDAQWLDEWGLSMSMFPAAVPGGMPLGILTQDKAGSFGLPARIPVAVSGHDHVCAALAMGAVEPGRVFDSLGTAEALIGALPERSLGQDDFQSGLLYGCHVARQRGYWMGGLSASGGSIEWLRGLFGDPPLSYSEMDALMESASPEPTSILYLPYLTGSGSPHTNPRVRGAFIGLSSTHTRTDLFKAVLEGTALEMEFIRRAGERMTGQPIQELVTAGGGTRNRHWLQIRADVLGCRILASAESEATLLGAALAVGIGAGIYASQEVALASLATRPAEVFTPNLERHAVYRQIFEQGYLALQQPLRNYFDKRTINLNDG